MPLILSAMIFGSCTGKQEADKKSSPDASWVSVSNGYTKMLLDVQIKHNPESGSGQGLAEFDNKVAQPTLADEDVQRKETEAVAAKFKAALEQNPQPEVAQDLQIMLRTVDLGFREEDYKRAHAVPFFNVSAGVFFGLRTLLDEQTPDSRRPAALIRIREYAGLEPGYKPLTEIAKQRVMEQMAKPGVIYPAKMHIETELGRNTNYLEGIPLLLKKYKLTGWEESYAKLKSQLTEYDAWVKATVLPKARTDFRLPPEEYAFAFEDYGIDIPPAQIAEMAHKAFTEIQGEMQPIAAQIAQQRHRHHPTIAT
jgi:hypothetical protein